MVVIQVIEHFWNLFLVLFTCRNIVNLRRKCGCYIFVQKTKDLGKAHRLSKLAQNWHIFCCKTFVVLIIIVCTCCKVKSQFLEHKKRQNFQGSSRSLSCHNILESFGMKLMPRLVKIVVTKF